jgi:hypothetical protein
MESPAAGSPVDPPNPPALNDELASLQDQISRATTAYRPNLLTRAADICAQAGAHAQALAYYGQAIDGYLAGGRDHAASAVCRKILQLSPASVRARCTLAWLALARQDTRHAVIEMQNYVAAARAAGQAHLATKQLVLLAQAATSRPVLEAIGQELLGLERSEESEAILRLLYSGGAPADMADIERDVWAQAHYAVKLTPYDLADKDTAAPSPGSGSSAHLTLAEVLRKDPTTPSALRAVIEGM